MTGASHKVHAVVQVVQTAAPVGIGLKDLEEALLFQAELLELKASQTRPVVGVVVEAKMTKGQGPVVTIIVKRGSLKVQRIRCALFISATSLSVCKQPITSALPFW